MACEHCGCHAEHSHWHSHGQCDEENWGVIISRLILGALLFLAAFILKYRFLFVLSYIVLGYDVVFNAVKNYRNIFNESFLMTIATFGAFILGEFPEACAVMLFYQIGEFLSDYATDKSKASIGGLIDLRSDTARLLTDNGFSKVSSESVHIGDIIRVASGEKVALDGVISKGSGYFDTKSLTGESVPKKLEVGDTVLSGYVACDSVVEITVTAEYSDSTASKILRLISDDKKAKSEKFITKFARIYTPIVVLSALLIAIIPIILGYDFKVWLYRAILFLVVSCPCALVVSIPLSFFSGIGCASLKGILIKGAFTLENAAKIRNFAFDKTGTLTDGDFAVRKVVCNKISEYELIKYAAYCEFYSPHPIARAIKSYFGQEIDDTIISEYREISGKGVSATVASHSVMLGSAGFAGIENAEKGAIYVNIDGKYAGSILVADKVKSEAKSAILRLKKQGVYPCILTGDGFESAKSVADELDIPFYASLLPQDKVSRLDEIKKSGFTAFVGDGINDAPVLTRADVGVSMGNIGSDAAIEASDVVLTSDNLEKLPLLIKISRKTMKIVKQNIAFSILVKAAIMLFGAFGLASIWLAVFADVGVLILAVINSLRAFWVKD